MKRVRTAVAMAVTSLAAFPALAAGGESGAPEKFLGLPVDLWKAVNLALLLLFLFWLLGKPVNSFFRKRKEDLNERLEKAFRDRQEAIDLAARMQERLIRLEGEIDAIRKRGLAEGETEKQAQLSAAQQESEQLVRNAGEEIERRLAHARAQLARAAADLATERARAIVARVLTGEDQDRLLNESLGRISKAS